MTKLTEKEKTKLLFNAAEIASQHLSKLSKKRNRSFGNISSGYNFHLFLAIIVMVLLRSFATKQPVSNELNKVWSDSILYLTSNSLLDIIGYYLGRKNRNIVSDLYVLFTAYVNLESVKK